MAEQANVILPHSVACGPIWSPFFKINFPIRTISLFLSACWHFHSWAVSQMHNVWLHLLSRLIPERCLFLDLAFGGQPVRGRIIADAQQVTSSSPHHDRLYQIIWFLLNFFATRYHILEENSEIYWRNPLLNPFGTALGYIRK